MPVKKTLVSIVCLVSVLGLLLGVQTVSAIGQITEPIVIKSAMRGQSATAIITVLNSEDKKIKVDLKADGQIASWISFYDINDKAMTQPINQLALPVKAYQDAVVKFEIPKDAANGVYTGVVAVATISENSASSTNSLSNISQRIDRQVSITVSDQETVAFNVSVVPSSYDLAGQETLKVRIIYDNQGNVAINPDAQLKISRDGQSVYNAIFPYPENADTIRPGQIKELPAPIEWPTINQPDGKYQAEMKFLVKGQAVKEDSFRFSIGTASPLSSSNGLLAAVAAIGRGNLTRGGIFVGGLLFLVVLFLILIVRKVKRSRVK